MLGKVGAIMEYNNSIAILCTLTIGFPSARSCVSDDTLLLV